MGYLVLDLRKLRLVPGGLGAGQSYTVTRTLRAPTGLTEDEEFYVFAVTDPQRNNPAGAVFELDKENNNDRSTGPMVSVT